MVLSHQPLHFNPLYHPLIRKSAVLILAVNMSVAYTVLCFSEKCNYFWYVVLRKMATDLCSPFTHVSWWHCG